MRADDFKVTVPEGKCGRAEIRKFVVPEFSPLLFRYGSRSPDPGNYTSLLIDGKLWMSDTRAEVSDHYPVIYEIRKSERVLIHGLGIGVVLQAALRSETVKHIDVVEISEDVINLVKPHYDKMATELNKSMTIHHDDAIKKVWPQGMRWNVVWHDIWISITSDNLEDMKKLHRKFGRRCDYQGSWARWHCEQMDRRDKKMVFI